MKPQPCPICQKPAPWEDNPFRPFCSKRCRLIDLGKWASDEYPIPGETLPDDDSQEPTQPDPKKYLH